MKRFDMLFHSRNQEDWTGMSSEEFIGFLKMKCQEMLTVTRLKELLDTKEKLNIKFGIDPTASDVHLGHIVSIMLLRQFAKVGHHVDLIIGDFTARVGDPTARETGRVPLSPEKITENMQTYTLQVGKYLDLSSVKVSFNSTWLNSMTLSEVFGIFQSINLAEAMQREDFRARTKNSQAVSLAEVCYGVLMGIDSVKLSTHIEIGGIDQLLNFQQCRRVMSESGMPEEVILMTPILEGISGDGRKMGKSYGNYIAVNSALDDKFGKVMSIPDRLILTYFKSFADVRESEIDELQDFIGHEPMEAKKQLATLLVAIETSLEAGTAEREAFERKFSKRAISEADCVEIKVHGSETLLVALFSSGTFASKTELRGLFEQAAVKLVNGSEEKALQTSTLVSEALSGVVKVGKRRLFKLVEQGE